MANKTVLITGAAQRLGASIAQYLHAKGFDIALHYNRSEDAAHTLEYELNKQRNDSVHLIQADLHGDNAHTHIIFEAYNLNHRLDALVNNASTFYPTPIDQVNSEQWQDLIDINMKLPFFLSQEASKHLKEFKGCIVNITDIHAERPMKDHPVYCAAKAGLVMLTRTLAMELAPDIRVNAVAPGAILWPEGMDETVREKILSKTAIKRQGKPLDIAKAVYFLIADADYMTGQILTIDGGSTLYS